MNRKFLISTRRWNTQQIVDLTTISESVRGIILGDQFCSIRAGEHGKWDIPTFAEIAKTSGLLVALQTPVYLTSRNFSDTFNLIRFLDSKNLVDLLFVQDVGLLSKLQEIDYKGGIIWGFWGRTRSDSLSRNMLDFLTQLGIQYLETAKPRRVKPLQEYGLKVVYRLRSSEVAAFGRVCYTQYITNISCTDGELCSQQQPELAAVGGPLKLKVKGYSLEYIKPSPGELPEDNPDFVTVYVENLADLPTVIATNGA